MGNLLSLLFILRVNVYNRFYVGYVKLLRKERESFLVIVLMVFRGDFLVVIDVLLKNKVWLLKMIDDKNN